MGRSAYGAFRALKCHLELKQKLKLRRAIRVTSIQCVGFGKTLKIALRDQGSLCILCSDTWGIPKECIVCGTSAQFVVPCGEHL